MPTAVSCKGFLREKSDSFLRTWTSYYYVLANGNLSKFRTQRDNIPLEHYEISPKTVTAVTDGDGLCGKQYCIALFFITPNTSQGINNQQSTPAVPTKSPLILRAETLEEKTLWTVNLKSYLEVNSGASAYLNNSGSAAADEAIVATMESIIDPCVVTDEKGFIMGFNKNAEQVFGYSKQEVLGKNVAQVLMPVAFSNVHDQYISRYLRTGNKKKIGVPRQVIARRKDGSTFPVIISLGEVDKRGAETKCTFVSIFRPVAVDAAVRKSSIGDLQLGGEYLKSSSKVLETNIDAIMIELNGSLKEEFDTLEKNYIILKHKIEIMEQENKRLQQEASKNEEALATVLLENKMLKEKRHD